MRAHIAGLLAAMAIASACGAPEGRRISEVASLHIQAYYYETGNRDGTVFGRFRILLHYDGECALFEGIRGSVNGHEMTFSNGIEHPGIALGTPLRCQRASLVLHLGEDSLGGKFLPHPERARDDRTVDVVVLEDDRSTLRLELRNVLGRRRFVVEGGPRRSFSPGDEVRMRWIPDADTIWSIGLRYFAIIESTDGHVFAFTVPSDLAGRETVPVIESTVTGTFDVVRCPGGVTCSSDFRVDYSEIFPLP